MGRILACATMLLGGLLAQPAQACNCPKEQLLQQNGTISMLGAAAKPRVGPVRPVVPQAAAHRPLDLPLLPTRKMPKYHVGLAVPAGDPLNDILRQP
jgi:hypothetical protein